MVENVLVTFDDFPLTAVIHMDEISNPASITQTCLISFLDSRLLVIFIGVSIFSHIVEHYFENFLFYRQRNKTSIKIDDIDMADI